MNKPLKITLIIIGVILTLFLCFFTYAFAITATAKLDESKLVDVAHSITLFDDAGQILTETSNSRQVTEFKKIPTHVKNAFVAIEDKRFYNHNGIDLRGLLRAVFNNVKSFSFKEGASTISQQLIKNTHLSSEKTLNRKLIEMKLARELERRCSKDEILEKYLNTIYFGDNCFGITKASYHYFNKSPEQLSIAESAFLAGIINAPSKYSLENQYENCVKRRNLVLKEMLLQNYITKSEYDNSIKEKITTQNSGDENQFDYSCFVNSEVNQIVESHLGHEQKFEVYTTINSHLQNIVKKAIISDKNVDAYKSAILLDKNGKIKAYYSNCKESSRQIGSVVKPIGVYAPCIEENVVDSCSKILDEKTDFGGYNPSNYKDIYRGNISVKESLCVSSNVCAVKLLNYLGIEKARNYLAKLNVETSDNDGYSIALGASANGAKLSDVACAYTVFNNGGNYRAISCINEIKGGLSNLFSYNEYSRKIFGDDTAFIVADMLNETAKTGTAKKLGTINNKLCAKTGTVGNENGNTDAYCISFDKNFVLAIWYGNKENGLLDNSITGGTTPTKLSAYIWSEIETRFGIKQIEKPDSVSEVYLDKLDYESGRVVRAEDIAPERFKLKQYFKSTRIPKEISTRFSKPKIETPKLSVKDYGILIELCQTEFINFRIYKDFNGKKRLIYDSKNSTGSSFVDNEVFGGIEYTYTIQPYFINGQKEYLGDETVIEKIKLDDKEIHLDWWLDEVD